MSYCSIADLTDRFGLTELIQLTDRDHAGEIDAAVAGRAIADAGGEIDGYLRAGGYRLPLPTLPTVLVAFACDIARYRLYDDGASKQVEQRYQDAIRYLRGLASGTVVLDVDLPPEAEAEVLVAGGRRVFDWGGY